MKKKTSLLPIIILCLVSFNYNLMAQSIGFNDHMINYNHLKEDLIINEKSRPINNSEVVWDSIRPLDEINKVDTANAYPYISQDGLRLYFTQGINNDDDNLFFTSRSDINSNFNTAQLLSSRFPAGSISCWLTNDELEIYYINNSKLFYSSRTSISSSFSDPVQVNFVDNIEGSIFSPSLTPDKQELYLFNLHNSNNVLKLMKTETLTYKIVDTLDIPSSLSAYPGQLSKDGLKYYICLIDSFDSAKLYRMDRPDITSQFDNLTVLNNNINSLQRTAQPSVTSNENELVFLTTNENIWSKNNLFIATNTTTSINTKPDNVIDFITVFPNPSNNYININFQLTKESIVNFKIYDLTFRTLLNIEKNYFNGNQQETLDLYKLTRGVYLLTITVENNSKSYKFIKSN